MTACQCMLYITLYRTVGSLDTVGAHCLQFKPGDTSHLYVGTEMVSTHYM